MSIERNSTTKNNKAWHWEPKVSLKEFTSAYQWIGKRKQTLNYDGIYFAPAGDKIRLLESEVKPFWKRHTK